MLLYILLFLVLWIPLSFVLSAVLTNKESYWAYPLVYKQLPDKQWSRYKDQISSIEKHEENVVVYFVNDNDVKIADRVYFHSKHICQFDPYYLYWQWKYTRWFKKHVLPFH